MIVYLLFTDKVFDAKKKLEKINSIKKSDVDALLDRLDFEHYSLSILGKEVKNIKI